MIRSTAGSKLKTSDLIKEIAGLAISKKFKVETWGYLDGYPLITCQRIGRHHSRKTKLVAALFHGDEIATSLGVVKFLKNIRQYEIDNLNLTILPVVNPTGHAAGTRENKWGEDPNRGYTKSKKNIPKEGKILMSHQADLFRSSTDGFLSLHEDDDIKEGAFAYCYSHNNLGHSIAQKLLTTAHSHVGTVSNEVLLCLNKDNQGKIKSEHPAIVFDDRMDSFDDWMHDNKVVPVIVTETPAKDNDLKKRIDANWKMLHKFCDPTT